jgi:mannose-6-phosphate isomerase-like protein (cupin superfamily)
MTPVRAGATRRVVTMRTTAGASALLADDVTEKLVQIKALPSIRFTDLWSVDRAPADNTLTWDADPAVEAPSPSSGGHILRLLEIEPDPPGYDPKSGFHTTNTIDHLVVLSGEVACLLDSGEVVLGPGDVLVQRGTQHAWSNRGSVPCRMLAVLIDALPLR